MAKKICSLCGEELKIYHSQRWLDKYTPVHTGCYEQYLIEKEKKTEEVKEHEQKEEEKPKQEIPEEPTKKEFGEERIWLLEIVAIAVLIISVTGAFIIWGSMGETTIEVTDYWGDTETETIHNPLWIFFGFMLLLGGIIVFAFLYVIASISENLLEIRMILEKKK